MQYACIFSRDKGGSLLKPMHYDCIRENGKFLLATKQSHVSCSLSKSTFQFSLLISTNIAFSISRPQYHIVDMLLSAHNIQGLHNLMVLSQVLNFGLS